MQRFPSVAEYEAARANYCDDIIVREALVEDAITGNMLRIKDQTLHISTATEAQDNNRTIPPEWNSLDIYERGVTGLIHFTNMNTQPWLVAGHPHGVIWLDHLSEAIEEGFISREEVEAEVEAGNVRPSLLSELGFSTNLDDSGFTPLHLRSLSKDIQGQADTTKPLNVMERLVSFFRGGVD